MCGCNKINGKMGKRKRIGAFKTSGVINTITQQAVPAALGFLAADLLTKNLSFLSSNPTVGNGVKIVAGAFLAGQGGMLGGLGVGMAANGVVSFAKPVFNLNGMGLLPPGVPSRYLAGVPEPGEMEITPDIQVKF